MPTSKAWLLAMTAACSTAFAQNVPIDSRVALRGDASGTWNDAAHPGQGITVEILDGARAIVGWYTYDAAGAPLWLSGHGRVERHGFTVELLQVTGGRFPGEPATPVASHPWGTAIFRMDGCNHAEWSWQPRDAGVAGHMPLTRLTELHATRCNEAEEFDEVRSWSFENGAHGFEPVFADLPPDNDVFYELAFSHVALPAPLDGMRGLRLHGNNHSDDLIMMTKKAVGGLVPGGRYRIELEVDLATRAGSGCFGIGGAPGEDVYVHLGASSAEPVTQLADNGLLRMSGMQFGQQSQPGGHTRVAGNLASGDACTLDEQPWRMKTLSTIGQPMAVVADGDGTIWVAAATDSGYEGTSEWYLTAMRVRLRAREHLP